MKKIVRFKAQSFAVLFLREKLLSMVLGYVRECMLQTRC
jgi:hypothetical protein